MHIRFPLSVLTLGFALLVQSASAQTSYADDVQDGSYLHKSCQAVVKMMNSSSSTEAGDAIEESDFCLGYFKALLDMHNLQGHNGLCVNNARTGTVILVYVEYMDRNPKLMDEPMVLGAISALHYGYACHKAAP
jgi:hypothetical protein